MLQSKERREEEKGKPCRRQQMSPSSCVACMHLGTSSLIPDSSSSLLLFFLSWSRGKNAAPLVTGDDVCVCAFFSCSATITIQSEFLLSFHSLCILFSLLTHSILVSHLPAPKPLVVWGKQKEQHFCPKVKFTCICVWSLTDLLVFGDRREKRSRSTLFTRHSMQSKRQSRRTRRDTVEVHVSCCSVLPVKSFTKRRKEKKTACLSLSLWDLIHVNRLVAFCPLFFEEEPGFVTLLFPSLKQKSKKGWGKVQQQTKEQEVVNFCVASSSYFAFFSFADSSLLYFIATDYLFLSFSFSSSCCLSKNEFFLLSPSVCRCLTWFTTSRPTWSKQCISGFAITASDAHILAAQQQQKQQTLSVRWT